MRTQKTIANNYRLITSLQRLEFLLGAEARPVDGGLRLLAVFPRPREYHRVIRRSRLLIPPTKLRNSHPPLVLQNYIRLSLKENEEEMALSC